MPFFPQPEDESDEGDQVAGRPARPLDVAIVGRPNVGKSTLQFPSFPRRRVNPNLSLVETPAGCFAAASVEVVYFLFSVPSLLA